MVCSCVFDEESKLLLVDEGINQSSVYAVGGELPKSQYWGVEEEEKEEEEEFVMFLNHCALCK